MGLISAALGAASGVLADQWKEYFYCEALPETVLVTKGKKRVSNRSSNTKGSDNIISNGSVIAVADGQCMIIVDQGKVVELCAEPGEFKYDTSTEPSAPPSLRPSSRSASALPSAASPRRISASTTSTPRRSWATSTVPRRPCPSAWWISA